MTDIKKIKEGDVGTFEKIFRHFYTALCLYAFSITARYDIAEEVVQDVFYNIWRDREHLSIFHSIKNYLYGAVRNHALRYLEHEQVQRQHFEKTLNDSPETEPSPQDLLEYRELENLISNTLHKLPERRREIFVMHRMKGRKYKEIAAFYAISLKTVEAEMTKAYRALRKEIEKYTLSSW